MLGQIDIMDMIAGRHVSFHVRYLWLLISDWGDVDAWTWDIKNSSFIGKTDIPFMIFSPSLSARFILIFSTSPGWANAWAPSCLPPSSWTFPPSWTWPPNWITGTTVVPTAARPTAPPTEPKPRPVATWRRRTWSWRSWPLTRSCWFRCDTKGLKMEGLFFAHLSKVTLNEEVYSTWYELTFCFWIFMDF